MSNKFILNQCIIYDKVAGSLSDITRPSEVIFLTTPANNCLQILLRNRTEITTQKELFCEVWERHGIPINVNTLYQNIAMIRKAFRQLGVKEDVIITIPRRGVLMAESVQVVNFSSDQHPPPQSPFLDMIPVLIDEPEHEPEKSGMQISETMSNIYSSHLNIKNLTIITLYLLLMTATAIISSFLYIQYLNTQSRFYNYHYFGDYKGCQTYVDSRIDQKNRKLIEASLNAAQISCNNQERVYASFFPGSPRESFIFCDSDILKISSQCRSSYQVFSEK